MMKELPKVGQKVSIMGYADLTFDVVDVFLTFNVVGVFAKSNMVVLQHPFTGVEMAFSMGELQEAVIRDHR